MLWRHWRVVLFLNTQPQIVLATKIPHFCAEALKCLLLLYSVHTQATLRRYQNSFCLLFCICITVFSVAFISPRAFSRWGNKSTICCLHTRMVLWKKWTFRTLKSGHFIPHLCRHCSKCLIKLGIVYLRWVYRSFSTLSWFWTVWRIVFTISELSL